MIETAKIWEEIDEMRHNRLSNYIVPGLHCSMVGGGDYGKVRLFEADRATRDAVTPHSHRFNFTALVLWGQVDNTTYEPSCASHSAEQWIRSTITQVCGANGIKDYKHVRENQPSYYTRQTQSYIEGQSYSMSFDQIHSIVFHKGTKVLFFEGPQVQDWDWMIEPWVHDKLVPSFKVEPWMFLRE